MGVRREQQRFPVAALLVFLLTAFAVSPPEAFYRGQTHRTRASRTVRMDDHEHDHALDAAHLLSDSTRDGFGDGLDWGMVAASASSLGHDEANGSLVVPNNPSYIDRLALGLHSGRAPPILS